jgi:hypothetical protein
MVPRRMGALLLAVLAGCASTQRFVHLDTGEGEARVHVPRKEDAGPMKLGKAELQQALQRLAREVRLKAPPRATVWEMFELDALNGTYLYEPRDHKLVPLEPGRLEGALAPEEEALTREYLAWCGRTSSGPGDCLGALLGGRYMDAQGRYTLALALSRGVVLEEMQAAFGELVDPQKVLATVLWTMATLMVLLTLPEPVTKGLAAVLTVALIAWVGLETFWNLTTGWLRLTKEAKEARTFEELRETGERYGRVVGGDAARAFALLAMAALGQTASGFSARVPTLPGSAQAAVRAEAQTGVWLPALGEVEAVAVTGEGLQVALAPGAVAMAVQGGGRADEHHIATKANDISSLRGGPWSPRFRRLFDRAGMTLEDVENIVPVLGHKGPHPERYHRIVYERLSKALANCRSIAVCRAKLKLELDDLALEISTPGTELNQLVTRGKPR